jgi:chromosome segregation ATPase
MYSRSVNNNIGRRSYNNYPQTPNWAPPGWSNQPVAPPRPARSTRHVDTPTNTSVPMDEFQKYTTELRELQSKYNNIGDTVTTLSDSVKSLEKTLIDNENLVNMQNYLYQANMTIANMVQEMITKYFNQTPTLAEPLNERNNNVSENSETIISEVKNTLEQVTQQSKDINNQSEQLNNLVSSNSDNVEVTSKTDDVSEDKDSEDEDSEICDGNVVDVTTKK